MQHLNQQDLSIIYDFLVEQFGESPQSNGPQRELFVWTVNDILIEFNRSQIRPYLIISADLVPNYSDKIIEIYFSQFWNGKFAQLMSIIQEVVKEIKKEVSIFENWDGS